MEATQMSIDGRMDKQNMIYHGIVYILKKGGNSDTCYNIDEP